MLSGRCSIYILAPGKFPKTVQSTIILWGLDQTRVVPTDRHHDSNFLPCCYSQTLKLQNSILLPHFILIMLCRCQQLGPSLTSAQFHPFAIIFKSFEHQENLHFSNFNQITPFGVVLNTDFKYSGFISIRCKIEEISTKIKFDQTS